MFDLKSRIARLSPTTSASQGCPTLSDPIDTEGLTSGPSYKPFRLLHPKGEALARQTREWPSRGRVVANQPALIV